MREQLKSMGLSYDWRRELATCDPELLSHEQKMFLDFLKGRTAYKRDSWVNWDPVENTVLANEQVIPMAAVGDPDALVERRKYRSGLRVRLTQTTCWKRSIPWTGGRTRSC